MGGEGDDRLIICMKGTGWMDRAGIMIGAFGCAGSFFAYHQPVNLLLPGLYSTFISRKTYIHERPRVAPVCAMGDPRHTPLISDTT